ncbi:MAG: hypothetical protein ACOX0Z_00865 [Candidatus Nanosyncoccaceae bacterium]|jgi:hypothetical protein
MQEKTHKKGMLMALIPAVLGIVLWLIVWRIGFIPAFVSFVIVYGTHWFYGKWGGRISKKEFGQVMTLAVFSILVAFFIGFTVQTWEHYNLMIGGEGGFFSADFWQTVIEELKLFSNYAKDFGLTVLFTVFAIISLVYDKKRNRVEKKVDEIAKKM